MSSVRVLVGTRKGAFVLTSDGKRERWDVCGPHFGGWEIYHVKGSPVDPNRLYASQIQRLVRAVDPALERRREDVGAGGQQIRLRGRPGHAPVVRRHAAPMGVQTSLAPGAVADGSGHGVRRGGRRGLVPIHGRRHRRGRNSPDCAGTARVRAGSPARAACACTPSFWIPADPDRIFIAISAAGAFRSDDAGETWRPINRGLRSK